MLKEPHYNFLKQNELFLGNVTATREQIEYFFYIYNEITGENKPITGCGRCVLNVKKRLKKAIEEYENIQGIQNK